LFTCKHFFHPDCQVQQLVSIPVKSEAATPSISEDIAILPICFFLYKKKQLGEMFGYSPLTRNSSDE
jgi:hypothetical protein